MIIIKIMINLLIQLADHESKPTKQNRRTRKIDKQSNSQNLGRKWNNQFHKIWNLRNKIEIEMGKTYENTQKSEKSEGKRKIEGTRQAI